MKKPKYALHPGFVDSWTDSDRHYITGHELARCYGLTPEQYFIWDVEREATYVGRKWEDYIHLFPRHDGDYRL